MGEMQTLDANSIPTMDESGGSSLAIGCQVGADRGFNKIEKEKPQ